MSLDRSLQTTAVLRCGVFVAVLLFVSVTVRAQTSSTFHTRLGEPAEVIKKGALVTRERFELDGELTVIIDYRDSGSPDKLRILPRGSKLLDVHSDPTVSLDTFRGLLHLLVQKGDRGKSVMLSFINIICLPKNDCAGVSETFENLTIYYNYGRTGMRYVDVTWTNK